MLDPTMNLSFANPPLPFINFYDQRCKEHPDTIMLTQLVMQKIIFCTNERLTRKRLNLKSKLYRKISRIEEVFHLLSRNMSKFSRSVFLNTMAKLVKKVAVRD